MKHIRIILGVLATICFIIAIISLSAGIGAERRAATILGAGANQAQQQAQTAAQNLAALEQAAASDAGAADGSACMPAGGGHGVIVIEGPAAANPGHADCVPVVP